MSLTFCQAARTGFSLVVCGLLAALPTAPFAQSLPPSWNVQQVLAPAGTRWVDLGDFNRHGAFVGLVNSADGEVRWGAFAGADGVASELLLAGNVRTSNLQLNDAGEIAGAINSGRSAFFRGGTGITTVLPTTGLSSMTVKDFNERGEMLLDYGERAYVYDGRSGGQMRRVGEILPDEFGTVYAGQINNRGVVSTTTVPRWIEGQPQPAWRTVLDDQGQLRTVAHDAGPSFLNDHGDLVLAGTRVLLADGTTYTYSDPVMPRARIFDFNEQAQAVGYGFIERTGCEALGRCGRAFSFENGQVTFLDHLFAWQGQPLYGSQAWDINEQGQILAVASFGSAYISLVQRVFLVSAGQVIDLTEQLSSVLNVVPGGLFRDARFNDAGQILLGYSPAGGSLTMSAYVVTPVPEPQVMALLLAGLGVLGWLRRRA